MRKITILLMLSLWIALPGCKGRNSGPTPVLNQPGNLLQNPSFEKGAEPWQWLARSKYWGPFEISDALAHSGKMSALLKLDVRPGNPSKRIHGVMQTINPEKFPAVAGGWYRIENWKRGVPRQYLQFVVIAWEEYQDYPNYQLRYVLEGVTKQPLGISNAKYTILPGVMEPRTGEWIHFQVPIRDDYLKLWGKVPDNYKELNFFFEARYDEDPVGSAHIRADVYYDDLYVGEGK